MKKQAIEKPSIHKNFIDFHPILLLRRKKMQTIFSTSLSSNTLIYIWHRYQCVIGTDYALLSVVVSGGSNLNTPATHERPVSILPKYDAITFDKFSYDKLKY